MTMAHFNATIRRTNPVNLTKTMVLTIMILILPAMQWLWAATYTWYGATPPIVTHGDVVTLGGVPAGTLTVPPGATVTIDGLVTGVTAGITLDIGLGATVQWNADFQAETTANASYCVNLSGSGTLAVSTCTISNTRSGGAINVSGAGTTVTVGAGATVSSGGTVPRRR